MLQGITEGVKKQAEQRISSRFIMYVPVVHDSALKKTESGRRDGKSAGSQKPKRARDYFDSAQKHNCGTIVGPYHEKEQDHRRVHEQRYTQIVMGRMCQTSVGKEEVRDDSQGVTPETKCAVVQPNPGGGGITVKIKQRPEYKQIGSGKKT